MMMLTMTTKEFRSMVREAGINAWQMYTNPCVKEGARTVGVMLTSSDHEAQLLKMTEVMKKNGHDPEAHNMRLTDSRSNRHYYGAVYIRGVAKFEK